MDCVTRLKLCVVAKLCDERSLSLDSKWMQEMEVSEEEESQNRIEDEKEREEVVGKKWRVKGKKSRLGAQEDNLVSVISINKNSES